MKSIFYLLVAALILVGSCRPFGKRNILVIGDSNGAREKGWVFQFQQLRRGGPMVNTSVSGNTIGFDGHGEKRLNSIDQLTIYLRKGFAEMGGVDEIIIALGTNDCKAEYRPNTEEREKYYVTLLDNIERFFKERGQEVPRIVLLSPPPMGPEDRLSTTFKGGSECVASFTEYLGDLAEKRGLCFSDLSKTQKNLLEYSEDGVHFDVTGYELIARKLIQDCY